MNREDTLFNKAIFTISLDMELLWGYAGNTLKWEKFLRNDPNNGRAVVNKLLEIFEKHDIPATWAIVGHLFLDHCELDNGIPHRDMPRVEKNWYSIDPCTNIKQDPLYYGKDIIQKILSNPINHEIGYHSFSHVSFLECNSDVAEAELLKGLCLAKEFGIQLKSFVFPKNEIGNIESLKKYGFKIYRGSNSERYSLKQNRFIRKLNGTIDKLIAPPVEPKYGNGIWMIPSSMFFCDPQIKLSVLPRAKVGLYRAIKSNKCFHIFLHPQNLLFYPSLTQDLDSFLEIVAKNRDRGKLKVMTMGEMQSFLDNNEFKLSNKVE